MNELKFTCPECGQHIQCNDDCAGENVPCPTCAKMIRVPGRPKAGETAPTVSTVEVARDSNPFQNPASDKVSYSALETDAEKAEPSPEEVSPAEILSKVAPPPGREESSPVAPESEASPPEEIHCLCPVCQSELRIAQSA